MSRPSTELEVKAAIELDAPLNNSVKVIPCCYDRYGNPWTWYHRRWVRTEEVGRKGYLDEPEGKPEWEWSNNG